jgi:ribosome-binding factor A
MDERRTARVSEAVREELSEIIGFEMEDPRLAEVTITGCHVSPDGRYATVKVALSGGEREQKQSLAGLAHATNFLRRELASRLQLRLVPEIRFEHDKHPDADNRIEILLARAKRRRGRDGGPTPSA